MANAAAEPRQDVTVPDPVASLLAAAEREFEQGEHSLQRGHLQQARAHFDRAIDLLLESPVGARSDVRLRDGFERLLDRIHAYDITILASSDSLAEKSSDPAAIDELLATSAFDLPVARPGLDAMRETVAADLVGASPEIPLPLNDRVLSYVVLFQGRLRDWVTAGLQRGTRYLPMIQEVFRAEGLPLDLAYVPLIESAFKPTAVSRAKAKGVWQFMRGTALENGLAHDWYIDERADPEKATRAAAKYLRTLHQMFGGDWHLALASYNGGPGLVQRALKRSGTSDFWALSEAGSYLPRETREYVPMILAAIIIARHPAQYGFEIVAEPPLSYDTVTLDRAVDIRRVAEWTGSSISEIQALNPELRRWTTPVRRARYELKVPVGTGPVLAARLSTAPASDLASLKWHTVRAGETIASLARRFGVGRADLAEANGLSLKSRLRAGEQLLIPRAPAPLVAQASLREAGQPGGAATTGRSGVSYRVRAGDTLYSIARRFGVSVDDLQTWNNLRGSRIAVGDVLSIKATATQAAQ